MANARRPAVLDPALKRPVEGGAYIGGGLDGLAAAAYLTRHAGVPGPEISIYEAEARLGGGFVDTPASHPCDTPR